MLTTAHLLLAGELVHFWKESMHKQTKLENQYFFLCVQMTDNGSFTSEVNGKIEQVCVHATEFLRDFAQSDRGHYAAGPERERHRGRCAAGCAEFGPRVLSQVARPAIQRRQGVGYGRSARLRRTKLNRNEYFCVR